jgi:hypothetical protein
VAGVTDANLMPRDERLMTMRSGSNWVYLKGVLDGVTTRDLPSGQQVSEVRLRLPLGRERERTTMLVPTTTWNTDFAERLRTLRPGTVLQIVGHVTARGGERLVPEVLIDSVAVDCGDLWRQAEAARRDLAEKEI